MDKLIQILKSSSSIIGIKQSFEDEGAMIEDVTKAKQLANKCNKILNLKIGGCEATTDMIFADSNNIDGVVAPMIESKFALKKYINASKDFNFKKYFNVETIDCVNNIDDILSSEDISFLDGLIIGRSDLCGSMGLKKSNVDDNAINEIVYNVARKTKSNNLKMMIGGSLSSKSIPLITDLTKKGLLDGVETRNIIISTSNLDSLSNDIKSALLWEMYWMEYKSNKYSNLSKTYLDRYETIKNRI